MANHPVYGVGLRVACISTRPTIIIRIIFLFLRSFVVVMRVVIIIFILIRDIKIRGADAAATPKRTQCTRCTRISTYVIHVFTHTRIIYTETRIIMAFWWLSSRLVWYLLELPPKKILKTQKQQPKNAAAAKRNDAYIINIIIYYYNIAITRWGRFTHVHLIHHIVERCYDIIYSSIRLSIFFLFFLGTSSRCAVILLINPIHYYTRVVLFGGRHRRVRDGNYIILYFILSRKIYNIIRRF